MSVSDADLIEAIETSWHILDEATPVVTPLDIPGVQGHLSPISGLQVNGLGLSRLGADTADDTIRRVIERFASEGKAFTWGVGPNATPPDLGERLEAAGLVRYARTAGMALTDLDIPIHSNPEVRIEQVGFDEARAAGDMLARSFGFGSDRTGMELLLDTYAAVEDRYHSRCYLAFADDHDEPVGWSLLARTSDPRVAWLGGSATIEEYRGRGIYRSFVARRLADAKADGAEAAIIQAVRDTSAPICAKLGFVELCSLDLYGWTPPT